MLNQVTPARARARRAGDSSDVALDGLDAFASAGLYAGYLEGRAERWINRRGAAGSGLALLCALRCMGTARLLFGV